MCKVNIGKQVQMLTFLGLSRCCYLAAPCVEAVTPWSTMRRSWPAGRQTTPTSTPAVPSAPPPLCHSSTQRSVTWDPSVGRRDIPSSYTHHTITIIQGWLERWRLCGLCVRWEGDGAAIILYKVAWPTPLVLEIDSIWSAGFLFERLELVHNSCSSGADWLNVCQNSYSRGGLASSAITQSPIMIQSFHQGPYVTYTYIWEI